MKYSKSAVIAVSATGDRHPLPVFGSIEQIWLVSDFCYFEVLLYDTICFDDTYQSYAVTECLPPENDYLCAYESLVDYNVFHKKKL